MAPHQKFCSYKCCRAHWRIKRTGSGPKRWSGSEVAFLQKNYRALGAVMVGRALGRGAHGVATKARALGVKSVKWMPDDVEYLRAHFAADGAEAVATALGFGAQSIFSAAKRYSVTYAKRPGANPNQKTKAIAARRAAEFGCSAEDIFSITVIRRICLARAAVAHDLRQARYSFTKIGQQLGVDHTSAIHAVRRYREMQAAREAAE